METNDIKTIALAAAAVWATFGSAMSVIYHLNKTRDRVLGWTGTDGKLTGSDLDFLIKWEYEPVWISVLFYIAIFTVALAVFAWLAFSNGQSLLPGSVCVLGAIFGFLGLAIQIATGRRTIRMMTERVHEVHPSNPDNQ